MSCETTSFVDAFGKHCAGKQSCDYNLHKFEPKLDLMDGNSEHWAKCCKKVDKYITITYGCAQIPLPAMVDEHGICASCSSTG